MDVSQNTQDEAVTQAYYDLLERVIAYFLGREIPVTLMSFCQWQGDEKPGACCMKIEPPIFTKASQPLAICSSRL